MSDIYIIIGQNIRDVRKTRGITMSELANRMTALGCKVTHGTIGTWERGERKPSAA